MTDSGKKILIVVSSHEDWSEAGRKTGYWIGEVSPPRWSRRPASSST